MKKKVLLSAIATIALCLCLIAGSTYALFTSNSEVNISVQAGKVEMTASITDFQLYSVEAKAGGSQVDEKGNTYEYKPVDEFLNGGTAAFNGAVLEINRLTPGDKVTFNVAGANTSDVTIQYRYVIECLEGYRLMDGLIVTVNGTTYESLGSYTSVYSKLEPGSNIAPVEISIELPIDAGNEYQEQLTKIRVVVEAVQGNAVVADNTQPEITTVPKMSSADDLANAIAAGATEVLLGGNVELAETLAINSPVTIDLNGYSVTTTAQKAFEVYADATIKGGTIEAANRCVDTRTAVELTLEDVTLIADTYSSQYKNPQPLTIGGADDGTVVNLNNVKISSGTTGYGIIAFVEADVTVTDSTFEGYNALYVKPGAENSVFNFVNCDITASTENNDVAGNSLSAIAVQTNDVTVNVDADSSITAKGEHCTAIGLGYSGSPAVTGNVINVDCPITGNVLDTDPANLDQNTINIANYNG